MVNRLKKSVSKRCPGRPTVSSTRNSSKRKGPSKPRRFRRQSCGRSRHGSRLIDRESGGGGPASRRLSRGVGNPTWLTNAEGFVIERAQSPINDPLYLDDLKVGQRFVSGSYTLD